jgi:hypothetical protein
MTNAMRAALALAGVFGFAAAAAQADECEAMTKSVKVLIDKMDPAAKGGSYPAALCAAHPGRSPVFVAWSDGNGSKARLRARRLRVELNEELVHALRDVLGTERVRLTKAR